MTSGALHARPRAAAPRRARTAGSPRARGGASIAIHDAAVRRARGNSAGSSRPRRRGSSAKRDAGKLRGDPCSQLSRDGCRRRFRKIDCLRLANCAILAPHRRAAFPMHKLKLRRITLAVLCALPVAAERAARPPAQVAADALLLLPPRAQGGRCRFSSRRTAARARREGDRGRRQRAAAQARPGDLRRLDALRQADGATSSPKATCASSTARDVLEGDAAAVQPRHRARLHGQAAATRSHQASPPRSRPGETRAASQPTDARGTAERLLFEGPERYRVERAELHHLRAGQRRLVHPRAARCTSTRAATSAPRAARASSFIDVPIFYSPYISFPLHQQRKSGFLTPHYGSIDATRRRADRAVLLEHRAQPRRDDLPAHHEQARHAARHASSAISIRTTAAKPASSTCPTTARSTASSATAYFLQHTHSAAERLGRRAQRATGCPTTPISPTSRPDRA